MDFRIVKNTGTFAALAGLLFLNACRDPVKYPGYEFMPDMYRGPALETYSPGINDPDSTTARKPVAGSIPRGFTYFNYPNTLEGYAAAGASAHNPLKPDTLNLAEGKRLFGIYCINCHGENGMADGNIVASGKFPSPPPSYSKGNSSRGGPMKDLTDGKIYHTITYGVNLMGSHASQLLPEERWKIVMYVHQLQHFGESSSAAPADSAGTGNRQKPAAAGGG